MTLTEVLPAIRQLSVVEKLKLIRILAEDLEAGEDISHLLPSSIKQEGLSSSSSTISVNLLKKLDPWTKGLIGVIQLNKEKQTDSYVDYLEEKYR